MNLSTTAKAPDALSPTFAANVGPDEKQVFSGPLQVDVVSSSSSDEPQSFEIVINFQVPFLYNPAKGNLLVDIRNAQGGTQNPPLDQEIDASTAAHDAVSRAFNYGDANARIVGKIGGTDEVDTLGLVTQFGTTTHPATTSSLSPHPSR